MPIIQVKITDRNSKVFLEKQVNSENPQRGAEKLSKTYPNHFITVTWKNNGKKHEIANTPQNMKIDEELVGNGEMSINDFIKKWFPGKKPKSVDIIKELQEEFGEEDLL